MTLSTDRLMAPTEWLSWLKLYSILGSSSLFSQRRISTLTFITHYPERSTN